MTSKCKKLIDINFIHSGSKTEWLGSYIDIDGNLQDRKWSVAIANFDNVIKSMITFFEVASLEGWPDILLACVDS